MSMEFNYKKVGFVNISFVKYYAEELARIKGFEVVEISKYPSSPNDFIGEKEIMENINELNNNIIGNGSNFAKLLNDNLIEAILVDQVSNFEELDRFIRCVKGLIDLGIPLIIAREEIDTSKMEGLDKMLDSMRSFVVEDLSELPF
ncbi:hypothetical protein [Ornithinibacillus sp. JPR2-1]|uniref:hypothetical protein n=1 Tax=Ornithinibacillus sp. JPR2-1 TaxID=2094019 RepID=UPI0031DBB431